MTHPDPVAPSAGPPSSDALLAAERAFDAGDFGGARQAALAVVRAKGQGAEVTAARSLLARLAPDPLVTGMFVVALAVFAWVVHAMPTAH